MGLVPNAPCGVESKHFRLRGHKIFLSFLMHRVELKDSNTSSVGTGLLLSLFLMHRVELKVKQALSKIDKLLKSS